MHWKDSRIAVVDVETTGFSNQEDRVIEVGIVIFEQGEVVERYGQLVNPGRAIPEAVVKLTGIKDEDVETEPPFEEVATEVLKHLQAAVIVGYNLSFDKGFLSVELERAGLTWPEASELDPLIFARQLHKGRGGNKLGQVAERLGISLENAHRAVDDAEATGHVLFALAEQLPPQLEELLIVQEQWAILQAQERAMWRRNRGEMSCLRHLLPVGPLLRKSMDCLHWGQPISMEMKQTHSERSTLLFRTWGAGGRTPSLAE